jgi:hypothetical protein
MAATAVRHVDLVRDQIKRIRVGRDRIDLQFDSLDASNMQPVDVERAGMPLLGSLIERRLNLAKFRDECLSAGLVGSIGVAEMKLSPCPAWIALCVPSRNCTVSDDDLATLRQGNLRPIALRQEL